MVNRGKVLVVDDEQDIQEILTDVLDEEGYEAESVSDGKAALEKLEFDDTFDLVISDIRMPRMDGFTLLSEIRRLYPSLKTALITAYDVNTYIRMALEQDIGNVITKSSPFNFDEFLAIVDSIITGNIFGLERRLSKETEIHTETLRSSADIDSAVEKIADFFEGFSNTARIKTVLREIAVNAVYYGARDEDGAKKSEWDLDTVLKEDEYIDINYAYDSEKMAISVVDQKGRLKKKDVLYWLDRNITRTDTGMLQNLEDEHGRGLFISREFVDRFIINIERGKRSEVIMINYTDDKYTGYKPLYINEI